MSVQETIGRLVGLDAVESVDEVDVAFAAPWASEGPAWVLFACLGLGALALLFYSRWQPRGSRRLRLSLAVLRAALLCIVLVILAEPILVVRATSTPRPLVWLLFDGTASMAIEDDLPSAEADRLASATGLDTATGGSAAPSRLELVRALVTKTDANVIARLAERFRLHAYLLDRPDGVRALDWDPPAGAVDGDAMRASLDALAEQLDARGESTALGNAITDLARRPGAGRLAGLIVFSDFDHNSGPSPIAAATKLGVPVFTVGVGPESAVDLAVDIQSPLLMKKSERTTIVVPVRRRGLEGASVTVRLSARRMGGAASEAPQSFLIDERTVTLDAASTMVEFQYTPDETGRFALAAEVDRVEGEVLEQNNRAERDVNIRDDFLRLMYVEYEPTWEWRFIKEVFHRDRLVGMRGFRTFLRSADPRVRETNELFLPTLTPPRSEFFESDVIFLGDMPSAAISTRFCEMTREWVSRFGGGLVVIAGPRFGPGELAATPLADMLPVVVDPNERLRDDREFALELTPEARQFDFMQLGETDDETREAWANLRRVPWYQPVARLHSLSTALAVHPTDTCADGVTPQPLIAIRRYGQGEVVFIGFNELWRLRRLHGELYYRRFWGQLIHRLGLSHALGAQKRFVVRTDRERYQVDDRVRLTVEAYDANYQPLTREALARGALEAEVVLPLRAAEQGERERRVAVPFVRDGVFELRLSAVVSGEHRVRVADPIAGEEVEIDYDVARLSIERRSAVRNAALERELALAAGGRSYDLETVARLPDELDLPESRETTVEVLPLWNTWLVFGIVIALMLGEWLWRKACNLP